MKRLLKLTGALCLGFLLIYTPLKAQDFKKQREELMQKQRNTRAEIAELNARISQFEERLTMAEKKYDRLYKQYENLKRIVALQTEKINKLIEEQNSITEEIRITENLIVQNREKLDQLVETYKKTLSYIYKHGRISQVALIFSASSINQMLVRTYYLGKFDEYRQNQVRQIKKTQKELGQNKAQLEDAHVKNEEVLAEIQEEVKEQEKKKELQEESVALLRQNVEQIQSKIEEERRQKEKLNNTLTALVLKEERVRKAQEEQIRVLEAERKQKLAEARTIENEADRAREVARYSTPVSREGFLEESELNEIESEFASGKGELPWPVEGSTISERFGRRRHPVYGTVTQNLGVEIVTKSREPVRVVHAGYVFAVTPVTGYGDVVVVSHGKYITAYGNLSRVMVRKNSILKEGDIIGLSGDEDSIRGETVFFMVRQGRENLDPEDWLKSK